MTETRILEILSHTGENTESFPKLSLDCVKNISKNIAELMYNSLNTKSGSNENKRLNILLLLQKWCSNNGSHLKIGQDNYDCLIESLIEALKPDTFLKDELETQIILNDCNKIGRESLIEHYKKVEKIDKEKSKFLDIIKDRDRKKCGVNTIFVPITLPKSKSIELFDVQQLMDSEDCEDLIPAKKINNKKSHQDLQKCNKSIMRQKQISLGYSLLNLNKSNRDMLLLNNIIKNLNTYEILQPYETEFINYLWHKTRNDNFSFDIPLQLLENFSFIYEKVFIKMCTNILQISDINNVSVMPKEAERILQLCSKSERLHNNIMNIIYELYACSGFSNKLRPIFSLIR